MTEEKDFSQQTLTEEKAAEAADEKRQAMDQRQEEAQTDDYYDLWLRSQAELINYKRRTEQRMEERREEATRDLLKKLLPVIDDFDIFFAHHSDEGDKVVAGVRMIYSKLMAVLKEMGLEELNPHGDPFDPRLHDAVMMEETSEAKEGHIVRVWQKGYFYRDSLLRPAKVITAKAKADEEKDVG